MRNKSYTFPYFQYIDTFIYFSHKLVCIPPPSWCNTLHRNGVKVLGTFIIERHTPHIERLLEQKNGEYTVARQLAAMANAYGFDGWLLNIEGEFPGYYQDYSSRLTDFISYLKRLLGKDSKVIWYDALTCDNKVDYQNNLSAKNLAYTRAANALFTNYKWTIARLDQAQVIADENRLDTSSIFFGIDVWAQNTNLSGSVISFIFRYRYPLAL